MIKFLIAILNIGVFSFGLLSSANAALESRLGGLAYYDTELNITWAADANINVKETTKQAQVTLAS